jgi:predicted alpha/beta hydrolase
MGYLPGRWIGFGSDRPAGVFWPWRRWCIRKGLYLNDIGIDLPEMNSAAHSGPTRMIAIADDVMVPPPASKRMLELMPGSSKELSVLRRDQFGLRGIGHLGGFERGNAVLWSAVVN